ncbi:MAG: hypothetical protein LBU84_18390 [Prevotella sp.]|jgi:hypothetical protein|nr:hypothetical protein [Prevotella sp.]
MVAKIGKGNNLFGTLIYNNQKVENEVAKIIHSNKVMQDKYGEYNMYLCNQSFAPFLAANRKTEEDHQDKSLHRWLDNQDVSRP